MTRTGFATGYDPSLDIAQMGRWLQLADDRGYDLGFFSETIALMRDSVSALSIFAYVTKRIMLCATQVARLRTPIVMAQTLASLDELSGGRMALALGACTRTHSLRHSLEPLDPVLTLTEWIEAIRLLVQGEKVSFKGQIVSLKDVGLGWRPIRRQIPLWVAATSKTGLQLAGTVGDGVVLNSIASPEYSRNAIRILRKAVEAAGKDWSKFQVAQIISCSMEDQRKMAFDQVRWEVASKFDPIQIPSNAGPRLRVGEPHIQKDDLPVFEAASREGGKQALMRALPESYIEGLTASGTPREVADRVQEYRDAGVKLPILRPAANHQTQRLLDYFAPK